MDICMHGIKRLFVEGLPLSMAIRQSVPRSIRVGVCVVFLRNLIFIAALIALQLKRINLVHLICLCESLHTRTFTFLINWFFIIMFCCCLIREERSYHSLTVGKSLNADTTLFVILYEEQWILTLPKRHFLTMRRIKEAQKTCKNSSTISITLKK